MCGKGEWGVVAGLVVEAFFAKPLLTVKIVVSVRTAAERAETIEDIESTVPADFPQCGNVGGEQAT